MKILPKNTLKKFRFFLFFKIITKFFPIIRLLKMVSLSIDGLESFRHNLNKESNFRHIFDKHPLKKNLIALDVGAQGGFNSDYDKDFLEKYEKYFDSILVEPIPSEFKKLKNKFATIEGGLWSSNCTKKLYIYKNKFNGLTGASSMYKISKLGLFVNNPYDENYENSYLEKEIDIKCTTINESLENLKIKELDFLKIDTQGAELEILNGLGRYRPLMMKIEVQIFHMHEKIPHWSGILDFTNNLDYMICFWKRNGVQSSAIPIEWDIFFIPNFAKENGKKIILERENEFIFIMLIFGQIKMLQIISTTLNFKMDKEIQKLKDQFIN